MRTARVFVVVALVVVAGCGGDDDAPGEAEAGPESTTSTVADLDTTVAGPESTTSVTVAATTTVAGDSTIIARVEAGSVVEGGERVELDVGEAVVIEVTADVADEVHVHGYDLFAETVPGEATRIEFTADIPGVFEVELEDAHLLLVELQVG